MASNSERLFRPENKDLPNLMFRVEDDRGIWIVTGQLTTNEKQFLSSIPASESIEFYI